MLPNGSKAITPQPRVTGTLKPPTGTLKSPLHWAEYNPEGRETVILLHDLFNNGSTQWDAARPFLPTEFRTLVVDWPGHGKSPLPPDPFSDTPRQLSVALTQWMTTTVRGPCHIVASGLGAYAATHAVLGYPQRIISLTLTGFLHHADSQVRDQWMTQRATMRIAMQTTLQHELAARYDHDKWQQMNIDILQDLVTYPPHIMPDDFERLERPLLIVAGDAVEVERRQGLQIRDWSPHGHLAVIPDAGHNPMIDAPGIFGSIVSRFLRTPNAMSKPR